VGWLRVGHFASLTPAIDVYVDGKVAAANVAFEQVTQYVPLVPGRHALVMRAASSPASAPPVASLSASVMTGSSSTAVVVNSSSGVTAWVFQDDLSAPPSREAKVRIVQAVPGVAAIDAFVAPAGSSGASGTSATSGASSLDVSATLPGPPAFSRVPLGAASPYVDLPAGSYDVQFRAAGSTQVVLSAHNWPVASGTVATVVVFNGPQGVTLEVLRDAAGPAAIPDGAMATGGGGLAHRHAGGLPIVVWALPIIVAGVAVASWTFGRARRAPALAGAASAPTGRSGQV
jgi:hypothetical protein